MAERDKRLRQATWQTEDATRARDARVAELEAELAAVAAGRQSLLDEYEGKMSELLQVCACACACSCALACVNACVCTCVRACVRE